MATRITVLVYVLFLAIPSCDWKDSLESDLDEALRTLDISAHTDIDSIISVTRDAYVLPGVAAGVVSKDSILGMSVCGMSNSSENRKLSFDDSFDLNSVTKSFTAYVVAELLEEEKLSLGNSIVDIFPSLEAAIHPDYRNVVLDDVLRHKAGFSRNGEHIQEQLRPEFTGTLPQKRSQFSKWLLQNESDVSQGTFQYSNAGYVVVGSVIEEVTGNSWESEVTSRLLKPLELTSAGFGWPVNNARNHAHGHARLDGSSYAPRYHDTSWYLHRLAFPGGGLHMSIKDLAKYAQFQLQGLDGRSARLSQNGFKQMHQADGSYGLGWFPSEFESYGGSVHDGSDDGYYSKIFVSNTHDIAVVVLTNIDDSKAWKACNIITLALLQRYLRGSRD
jgi:CubicO group peptidase (beta-lactamase class C family)